MHQHDENESYINVFIIMMTHFFNSVKFHTNSISSKSYITEALIQIHLICTVQTGNLQNTATGKNVYLVMRLSSDM